MASKPMERCFAFDAIGELQIKNQLKIDGTPNGTLVVETGGWGCKSVASQDPRLEGSPCPQRITEN